jgi:hypothetical protein
MATFPPDASLILCDHHHLHNFPYVHITRMLGMVLPHDTVVSSTAAAQCIAESVPCVAVSDAVETPAATSSVVLAQTISDMPTQLSDCDDDSCPGADCIDDSGKQLNIRESRAMRVLGLLKARDPSNGRNSRRAWQQVQHWVATRAAVDVVVPCVAVLDAVGTPAATSSVVLAQTISDMPTLLSDCDDDSCSSADCDDVSGSGADLLPKEQSREKSWAMRVLGLLRAEDPSNGRNSRRAWQQVQHWVTTRAAVEDVTDVGEYAQPSAMFQHVTTARTTDARSALHSYFAQFAGCRNSSAAVEPVAPDDADVLDLRGAVPMMTLPPQYLQLEALHMPVCSDDSSGETDSGDSSDSHPSFIDDSLSHYSLSKDDAAVVAALAQNLPLLAKTLLNEPPASPATVAAPKRRRIVISSSSSP